MSILLLSIVILAVIIIALVMFQSKGTGLSIVPGTNDFGKFERRWPEKTLHTLTILLVIAFVILCILHYLFN